MELISAIDQVRNLVLEIKDEDLLYGFNVAAADVETYIKHQTCGMQQKLAKINAFELLDESTAFWLKDYCQKILPAKCREGKKEYFDKKGLTLHVDVFFLKENGQLRKKFYFTAVYRCEQGLIDSLCLAEVVLPKVRDDFPAVRYLYAKSENASSYHGNYYVEALYNLCKAKQFYLKQYDYSELSHGKDQCDREAAGAKCVIRSFMDAGNDLLTAEATYDALHHGKGIQNADVAVVSIDSQASELSGPTTIININNYHSFQFFSDHMMMWRYFQIGKGKKWKYTGVTFHSSVQIIKPYSSMFVNYTALTTEKPHVDRSVNSLKFCPQLGCFFFNWDSPHARLNSHYEAWSYKKRSTKTITGYRKSV